MRKMLASLAAIALLAACNRYQKTEDGLEYKIFRTEEGARTVAAGDMLLIHMKGVATGKDTVLFDSYKTNKPFYIPAEEPSLHSIFSVLKKGDSAEFKIVADSLYTKSFHQPLPAGMTPGEIIKFTISLNDIYNQQEMQKSIQDKNKELLIKDSVGVANFMKGETGFITTPSGLHYKVVTKGTGKKVKKGDKVTVKYRGTLLDGTLFDETKEGQPDFTFPVGMGQVIVGWDEGLQLMGEGDSFKFLIPWRLAYGEQGTGPIPPFSTLVFEVTLKKIN